MGPAWVGEGCPLSSTVPTFLTLRTWVPTFLTLFQKKIKNTEMKNYTHIISHATQNITYNTDFKHMDICTYHKFTSPNMNMAVSFAVSQQTSPAISRNSEFQIGRICFNYIVLVSCPCIATVHQSYLIWSLLFWQLYGLDIIFAGSICYNSRRGT